MLSRLLHPVRLLSSVKLKVGVAQPRLVVLGLIPILCMLATPALAHHPLGGRLPSNMMEGLLSGVGHPVIGLDHLAFVIAAGLLATTRVKGFWIPLAFVAASIGGTAIHLASIDLPVPELIISVSVLAFGAILAMGDRLNLLTVILLAALSGIFHGFAYGEGIFGAEPTPMVAYLIGFAGVQAAISLACMLLAKGLSRPAFLSPSFNLRSAGFTLAGVGLAFVSSAILG